MTSEKIVLPRSGLSAASFQGELLAEVVGPPEAKRRKNVIIRYHELQLYRTDQGKYVVAIGFRTELPQESNQDSVYVCDTQAEVEALLIGDQGYDPCQFLEGFPPWDKFKERQERLEMRVTEEFESRVGQLLASAGFVEELE